MDKTKGGGEYKFEVIYVPMPDYVKRNLVDLICIKAFGYRPRREYETYKDWMEKFPILKTMREDEWLLNF